MEYWGLVEWMCYVYKYSSSWKHMICVFISIHAHINIKYKYQKTCGTMVYDMDYEDRLSGFLVTANSMAQYLLSVLPQESWLLP